MASLHKSKLLLSLIVTIIAFLICFGIDMFFLLQSYALPQPTFSASIIFYFSDSLGIALFIHSCVKILVTILFVTSVVHLAMGLRRTYLVLPVGLLIFAAFGFVTNL